MLPERDRQRAGGSCREALAVKTIIAGSRHLTDYAALCAAMEMAELVMGITPTVVLSGSEPTGVDVLGERWAAENNIPCERHPAKWGRYPRTAGLMRNVAMGRKAEAIVAVMLRGGTPGTKHMLKQMAGKPSYVLEVD